MKLLTNLGLSHQNGCALAAIVLFVAASMISPDAVAASTIPQGGKTIGDLAGNVTNSLEGVSILAEALAYVSGFFLGFGSLLKFRAYRDNPQQTPLGTPITWLVIAVALIALPSVFGTGMQTLWGGDAVQVKPW